MTFQRGCSHGFMPGKCSVEGCSHKDTRPLVQQLFGRNSNSQLAAQIARQNPAQYQQLRQEGMALGLLPQEKIPLCLQNPE
jgi:hypothetical protein